MKIDFDISSLKNLSNAKAKAPEEIKLALKKAAGAVMTHSKRAYFTNGKGTKTILSRGEGLIYDNIRLDFSTIDKFEAIVYAGGPAAKPARVHDPIDGRKQTTIRPVKAKMLFIPLVKTIAPDKNWKSRPPEQRGKRNVDFVLKRKITIPARPFLTPALKDMKDEITEYIAEGVERAIK